MKPRLLDRFCCEGGASEGYARAGFDVYGIDIFTYVNERGKRVGHSRKRYPFPSHQGWDEPLMGVLLNGGKIAFGRPGDGGGGRVALGLKDFAAVTASPPCWKYSITNHNNRDYPDLLAPTRQSMVATGLPYVIENVEGAPLIDPLLLCGSMFDLKATDEDGTPLRMERHRLFESNVELTAPHPCKHDKGVQVAGSYGGARRDKWEAKHIRKGGYVPSITVQRELLGIDWMTQKGMFQSIPPAYTEHIGRQLILTI